MYRNTGRADERLARSAECPRGGESVWQAFCQLGRTRARGLGAGPITFVEIEAWQRLCGVILSPWELDTLIAVDAHVLGVAAEKDRTKK